MLQLKTVITHPHPKRPWQSTAPYTPNANAYYLSGEIYGQYTFIGGAWKDYHDLHWNYAAVGAIEPKKAYPSWDLPKVLEALWQWRREEWIKDREWRKEYRLPVEPRLERLLRLEFDFGIVGTDGTLNFLRGAFPHPRYRWGLADSGFSRLCPETGYRT